MLIELAEFSQKLQTYRTILDRIQFDQETYQRRRERLSKLSQRRRSEIRKPDVVCYMCNVNIQLDDSNSFATCRGCERLVCRSEGKQCCEWIAAIGIWECRNCHSNRVIQQKAGEWLLNQLTSRLQNPGPVSLKNDTLLGLSITDSDDAQSTTSSVSSSQRVKVREFIEELLSSMLNGPLDDVSVGQLTQNENYVKVFHRYHSRLSRCLYNLELSIHQSLSDLPMCEGQKVPDSPSDQHFELRKMLQRILDEVAKLPELLNHSGLPLRPEEHLPYFSPKKYEQLLATAVLNKVVESYRNQKNFEHVDHSESETAVPAPTTTTTTGAAPVGSATDTTGSTLDINHNKVTGKSLLNEANLRQMSLNGEEGAPNAEHYNRPLSESDESYLSDYIQRHTVPLPDLSDTTTTGSGSAPEDDLASIKSNATDGTWEENWLFKKRQLKSTESSIAMLVPSPTEEVKALIGDKNADEVSDLSEAGSDVEEYDSDSNQRNASGTSKSLLDDDPVQDSLVSINSIPSHELVLSEAKNDLLLAEKRSHSPKDTLQPQVVDELISIGPHNMEQTEATNPAFLNPFLSEIGEVTVEENNNVVETDDGKLMQERILNAPKQRDSNGSVLHPIGVARTTLADGQTSDCDRKEVPIDRAQLPTVPPQLVNGHTENGVDEVDNSEEKLIPGSIAEREHLKWRNASPIANNPYSPDVLQKRLSESNRKSNLIDIERLAAKDLIPPPECPPVQPEPAAIAKEEDEDPGERDRSLQSVLGGNPTQYQRYGRDYYINDAKRASGTRKHDTDLPAQLSHSTDDEKSLLLSQKQDRPSPASSPEQLHRQQSQESFPCLKSNSCGTLVPTSQTEDIFSAGRPIEVAADDPILKKGTKLEYLSTPAREIYLVPAEEPITPRSHESSSEISLTSRPDDSLTYSEDSDVTRIYEIGTGESKLVHGSAIGPTKANATPPTTPSTETGLPQLAPFNAGETLNKLNALKLLETELVSEEILEIIPQVPTLTAEPCEDHRLSPVPQQNDLLKPLQIQVKPLSPDTIRFFSPKKPFTGKAGNLSASSALSQSTNEIRNLPQHPTSHYHSTLHIDFPGTKTVPTHEFIIEKEVMEVLPSVKELAKCYSVSQQDVSAVPKPLLKPRDFIRQSSDMLHQEPPVAEVRSGMPTVQNKNRRMYSSTNSISPSEELREIRRVNVEVFNKPTFAMLAPGHSITARSLSKQIRDELKTNATDDTKVHGGGHISPERPSSPVLAPGHLRSSIQFFENLSHK